MVDQGSEAKIMYPNLYKGLGLKPKNLSKYDTPLVGFNGKVVTPEGQIKLPVVIDGKEVKVNFIVVNPTHPTRGGSKLYRGSCHRGGTLNTTPED